ncbi:RING-type domain-containing protein [Citrus sinensis]|uniref:RING-type domain-containing protein n=1 Tax=Citrus sinensis TaxID=2711 RepID=A0ACB8LRE0_CITSI|nr:RING-type domain-containing protein [Citrus sinensis]
MMVMEILISLTLLFVGIAALVVIHVCVVGRAFRRGYEQSGFAQGGFKMISSDDLKQIPCFEYKAAADRGSSPVDCVVCLENFRMGDKCRLLPNCRHSFHAQCIDSWLLKTPICPICRTRVSPSKVGVILKDGSSVSGDVAIELT